MRKHFTPATAISLAALFFSLTGAGLAASHYLITSVSQIKPSVQNALRGQTGLQGATGAQGIAGTDGHLSAKLSIVTEVSQDLVLPPSGDARVIVTCPAGYQALSGGYASDYEAPAPMNIIANQPLNSDSWLIRANGGGATGQAISGYVVCGTIAAPGATS
jgi:hypothetical protein